MNGRKFPEWGEMFMERVTDYLGNECMVCEPAALALYPMSKTINDTSSKENLTNAALARSNNPHVNLDDMLVYSDAIIELGQVWDYA